MANITSLSLEQLKKLSTYKSQYESATTAAGKAEANRAATALRSSAGILYDSYSKSKLDELIASRSTPETGKVTMNNTVGVPETGKVTMDKFAGVPGQAFDSGSVINDPYAQQNDLLQQLMTEQREATMRGLEASRQTSLSALGAEETNVKPQYAEKRSQARTQSQLGAKSFADFLATRGLSSSGGAALGESNRQGALQGQIGGLQEAEQAQLGDIGRRRTLTEQNYATGVQGADAEINAQSLQNQLNILQNQQADQKTQDNQNKVDQANQLVNDKNAYLNTIGQFSNNYQAEIDNIANDNDPSNDWQLPYLRAARQEKINKLGADQDGQLLPQAQQIPQITSSVAMDLWETIGTANESIAQALGVPVNTRFPSQPSGGSSGGSSDIANVSNVKYNDIDEYVKKIEGEPLISQDLYNAYISIYQSNTTSFSKEVKRRALVRDIEKAGYDVNAFETAMNNNNPDKFVDSLSEPKIFKFNGGLYSLPLMEEYLSQLYTSGILDQSKLLYIINYLGLPTD